MFLFNPLWHGKEKACKKRGPPPVETRARTASSMVQPYGTHATWISTCSSSRLKYACDHNQSPAQSWSGEEHMMGNSLFVAFFSVSLNTTSHKSTSLLACPPVPPGKEPSLLPPNESEALSAEKPGSFQVGGFCTSVVMPRAEHVQRLPKAAPDGASEVSGGDAMHTQPAAKPSP